MKIEPVNDQETVEETYTVTRSHQYWEYRDKWVTSEDWRNEKGEYHNTAGPACTTYEHTGDPDQPNKILMERWYLNGEMVGQWWHPDYEQEEDLPKNFAHRPLNQLEP